MRGHRLNVIALSLMVVGACGQRRTVTLDWAVDHGPLMVDRGVDAPPSPDKGVDAPRPDLFVPLTSWAVSAGGVMSDYGYSIAVDGSGNSYVTGYFYGAATFGGTTLTSQGKGDIFVAKLDGDGKFVWAVSTGGTSHDRGDSIAVDGSGNSYVTGNFSGTVTFGSTTLTSTGSRSPNENNIFVAKLDSSGAFVWAVSTGGSSFDQRWSIAVDGSGNSYVTGGFSGTATFGSTTLTSTAQSDIFVAKLTADGKPVWAVSTGGSSYDRSWSIAVDGAGNSHITGRFHDTVPFGSTTLTSKGSHDLFVAKLDSGGTFVWAISNALMSEGGLPIALDGAGNSYVTSNFYGTATFGSTTLSSKGNSDIFVAKLDSGGKFVWAVSTGGKFNDRGDAITVDGSGNSYITGSFSHKVTLGSTTLTSKGLGDILVAKLDSAGKWLWAVPAGSTWDDEGLSISTDAAGDSYIAGRFMGTASFGNTTLISNGIEDIFVARLDKIGKF